MTIAEQFKQYVWIIKTIYNTRRISFEELNERRPHASIGMKAPSQAHRENGPQLRMW